MKAAKVNYDLNKSEIEEMLRQIKNGLENYDKKNGKDPHWGHVGTMKHYRSQLKDIRDSLNGTGEYAN